MQIVSLFRYPVKGFSPERLSSVEIATAEGFPLDRMYALLRTNMDFNPGEPQWLAKANFIMLMMHEKIAQLKTRYDDTNKTLYLETPDGEKLAYNLNKPEERKALENFIQQFMPERIKETPRLLEAKGHMFTDKADKYISMINLASVRELEKRWGEELDPLRFRANVYIDGAEPFSERDWVGQEIQLGNVIAKVDRTNGRCAATNVNPDTGVRDRNIPGKLREMFGHKDLGIYLKVIKGGRLQEGDTVSVQADQPQATPGTVAAVASGQWMCSACYYLFDPGKTDKAWHEPGDIPQSWRCPDCGAGKEMVAVVKSNPSA